MKAYGGQLAGLLLATCLTAACSDGTTVRVIDDSSTGAGSDTASNAGGDGSSGGDSSGGSGEPTNPGSLLPETPGAVPELIVADPSVAALREGERQRAYTGRYDNADAVFILDTEDRFLGWVQAADADVIYSFRGDNLSGAANGSSVIQSRVFTHSRQLRDDRPRVMPFANYGDAGADTFELSLDVADGVSVQSTDNDRSLTLAADTDTALIPLSINSVQGDWTGLYTLCDSLDQNCSQLVWQLSIQDAGLTGETAVYAADGTNLLPSDVSGDLVQYGEVVAVEFIWNTYRYEGFLHASPDQPRQLKLIGTTDSEIADERVLALILERFL